MAPAQMIEGTPEEVARQLQQSYAGQKLRVFVEAENDEDAAIGQPVPPFAVRDQAHLEALLLEGIDSPVRPFTSEMLDQMRQEVKDQRSQKRP